MEISISLCTCEKLWKTASLVVYLFICWSGIKQAVCSNASWSLEKAVLCYCLPPLHSHFSHLILSVCCVSCSSNPQWINSANCTVRKVNFFFPLWACFPFLFPLFVSSSFPSSLPSFLIFSLFLVIFLRSNKGSAAHQS